MPYSVALRERDQLLHGARMDNRVGVEQEQVLARSRIRCSVDARTKADVLLQCEHTRLGNSVRIISTVPSPEALSSTINSNEMPLVVSNSEAKHLRASLHSYVTTTTESLGLTAVWIGSALQDQRSDASPLTATTRLMAGT